jgi:hypothetical protein
MCRAETVGGARYTEDAVSDTTPAINRLGAAEEDLL